MSVVRVGFDGYIQHRLQSRDGESGLCPFLAQCVTAYKVLQLEYRF